jgi:enoyl-CoA hydratase
MSEALVLYERRDKVALITINRPKAMNALDLATLESLQSAVTTAMSDQQVRVLVLTGAGNRSFVAGGDIADLNSRGGLAHYLEFAEKIHSVFRSIEACDKPTLAAVNGWTLGGGVELLLCLDIRIAAESAKFGVPEIKLGLFPGAGGSQRLLRQISPCKAKELMFTGEHIGAREAESLGLINKVVPDGELLPAAMEMANLIAQKSPLVLKLLKRTLDDGIEMPPRASLRYEQAMIGLVLDSADSHEGCSAFIEKRSAEFRGA